MTSTTSPTLIPGVRRHRRKGARKRGPLDWIWLILVSLFALAIAFPFILILINSFKSPEDYATSGALQLPASLDFSGIEKFWTASNFPLKLWNSIFISTFVAVFAVVISVLNAFALGIGRVRGRAWIIGAFMLANMLPQEVLLYPLYYMFKQVGLYDNVWSVIIIFTVIQSAFGTYLLASVYGTFPKEVLEAAALDGASRWKTLRYVIFPISRPTLSVLLIFFFIWTWNEFLLPLIVNIDPAYHTLPVGLLYFQQRWTSNLPLIAAGATIIFVPLVLAFLVFQKQLVRGLTEGALKG